MNWELGIMNYEFGVWRYRLSKSI